METVGLASRLLLSCVFFFSGFGKIIWPGPDSSGMLTAANLRLPSLVRKNLRCIPYIEIALASSLAIGFWPALLASLSLAFLLVATLLVWRAIRRGYRGGCSCFGHRVGDRVTAEDVLFNLQLIGGAVFLLYVGRYSGSYPLWEVSARGFGIAILMAIPVLATRFILTEIKRLRLATE